MNQSLLRVITDDEIRRFDVDGIVCLRGMFDANWLARLVELVEEDMAAPGPLTMELEQDGKSGRSAAAGRFFFDTFMWTRMEGFRDFVFCSPAGEIAGLSGGLSGPGRHNGLLYDLSGDGRVLLEMGRELLVDNSLDNPLDLAVSEFCLGLPFELRFGYLNADHRCEAFPDIVSRRQLFYVFN